MAFCLSDLARVIPFLSLCPLSWVDGGLSVLKKAESVVNCLVLWTRLLSSLSHMAIPYSVTSPYQSLASLPKTCLLLNHIGFPWLESAPKVPTGIFTWLTTRSSDCTWPAAPMCPCELIWVQPFSVSSEARSTLSRCGLHAAQAGSCWHCGVLKHSPCGRSAWRPAARSNCN